jgi:pimeloyl-ACP methyl ester carboxylesterase
MMIEAWVETEKGRLFTRAWRGDSEKSPIVLFHDSLGCVELWREFPKRLAHASGRTVIAYDRLGFGRSDPYPGRLDFDFIRNEARDTLPTLQDQFGFERFVAFGHSVGGGMAVIAAGAFPDNCEALVTVAAQAFVEGRTLDGIRVAERNFAERDQFDRLRKYHGDKAGWVLNAWVGTWLSPNFQGWSLNSDLARVRCPVLVVHGEEDEYGSVLHPQRIASFAAGPSVVAIIPKGGHVPHRECEELLVDLVCAFLREPPHSIELCTERSQS